MRTTRNIRAMVNQKETPIETSCTWLEYKDGEIWVRETINEHMSKKSRRDIRQYDQEWLKISNYMHTYIRLTQRALNSVWTNNICYPMNKFTTMHFLDRYDSYTFVKSRCRGSARDGENRRRINSPRGFNDTKQCREWTHAAFTTFR